MHLFIVSSQASQGRQDALYDTTDSDLIVGGGGNDVILGDKANIYNHHDWELAA